MRGLYAIVDLDLLSARGVDPIAFARAVLEARPAALQLRAKNGHARAVLGLLRALAALCRAANVPLVANDRADLAMLAGADMVHVGQTDPSPDAVRRIAPGLGVGVSTHDLAQLAAALDALPSYVAFGPVFPTASKADPDPVVGLEGLSRARALVPAAVPLVAIGGITPQNAGEVSRWADAGAVIGALLPPADATGDLFAAVTARARALHERLGGSPAAPRLGGEARA